MLIFVDNKLFYHVTVNIVDIAVTFKNGKQYPSTFSKSVSFGFCEICCKFQGSYVWNGAQHISSIYLE